MKKLYNIKNNIYNMRTRNECLTDCIKNKLDTSFYNYDIELKSLCDILLCNNSSKVLKNIVKSQNKENIENGNN